MDSKIQIITSLINENLDYGDNIRLSHFYNYDSVDSYKYNIIDLNNSKLWDYDTSNGFISSDDITTLINAIKDNGCKSEFIIMMPIDLRFKIKSFSTTDTWLRNEPEMINMFLGVYFNLSNLNFVYGMNNTQIGKQKFKAGFHITTQDSNYSIITKNTNDKITSIKHENLILTTLQLTNRMEVINFINGTLLKKETNVPEWFEKIEMFDDSKQKEIIKNKSSQINKLESEITIANEKLEKNNEYKSILYTQGKPLEKTVLKMLSEILNYDLSQFIDEKSEDFLVILDDVTFVGEIKGVNSNLKNKHLAQLNIHLEKRRDKVKGEHLKPLMIINRFKEHPPEKRKPIDEEQIKLAIEKYEHTLIITVETLLDLYWQFIEGNITTKNIIKKFKENEGLFEL